PRATWRAFSPPISARCRTIRCRRRWRLAQQGAFTVGPRFTQALAWQRVTNGDLVMVDKNGGLNNTATYIGMIPQRRLGIVILSNCGGGPATPPRRQNKDR